MRYVVGVDIGATKTRVGLFKLDGELLKVVTATTPQEGSDEVVAHTVISQIFKLVSDPYREIAAIGVGTVGPIDIRRGDVVGAPNVRLKTFRLKAPIEEVMRVKTYVVNDCVAAVWGEYIVGAGRGFSNVVYVTLSTGIGCGVVVDDHLLLGKDGNAHEVGHVVIDCSGRFVCGCGSIGHWEGIASGANIPRTAATLAREWGGPDTEAYRKALEGSMTSEELFQYRSRSDVFADYLVNFLAEINAAGVASVVNIYDPEILSLGGSIALRNPGFIEVIARKTPKYTVNRMPKIVLTPLGENAVLIGAAAIALNTPLNLVKLQGS
ncbi:MAG: ROK family protein [Sulfolobales archaeon]|nr:ROK family protein [Sulfolobales archaeon]MDW8082476.1 ROK family protein [Sulfolobales archaeon]